mmetsp:Transcript_52681/g.120163  ORF Transcript_52681/g.120163 Transcript_52681/m.120163 type:complete len:214 (+) Transcript_52681:543-1184(+)
MDTKGLDAIEEHSGKPTEHLPCIEHRDVETSPRAAPLAHHHLHMLPVAAAGPYIAVVAALAPNRGRHVGPAGHRHRALEDKMHNRVGSGHVRPVNVPLTHVLGQVGRRGLQEPAGPMHRGDIVVHPKGRCVVALLAKKVALAEAMADELIREDLQGSGVQLGGPGNILTAELSPFYVVQNLHRVHDLAVVSAEHDQHHALRGGEGGAFSGRLI